MLQKGKQRIKVSTPWSHLDFNTRISKIHPFEEYEFVFDKENELLECDYWIVWGGIKSEKEKTICPPGNLIYLTDEVHEQRFFSRAFLEQFSGIITCRKDLEHTRIIPVHELNTWMIDKDFDWVSADREIPKPKTLSVISSDQTWLPGHKLRYAFVNKLIGHFKDKLDVFGRGFNPIDDKFTALADYKYSIAIENSVIPGYFTEKITDCYLTHTLPIYYGCPDIAEYFDDRSFFSIDPHDFRSSVEKIERIIEEDRYTEALPFLVAQKKRYLDEYHIFSKLVKILGKGWPSVGKKQTVTIRNERCFQRGYSINKLLNTTFRKLRLPGSAYFQFTFDQSRTFANKSTVHP